MSDVEKVGRKALSTLPGPLKRGLDGTNLQFISAPPERSSRNLPAIASVDENSPDTIQISDPQRFTQGAPQVLAHEATHLWQNNLPPKLQQMIPPDNPQNPYDFGGTAGLKTMRAQGKRLLDLPREKEASILQHSMVDKDPAYKPWIEDMNSAPLSQIMPTRPGQQGIETTPRPPRPPATMYADQLVGKGDPPPVDYGKLAEQYGGNVVHTGTGGPDYNALAQQFGGTVVDSPDVEPGTGMNRYGEVDSTPRLSTQLAKEALPAAGQLGIGALKGLGSDLLSHTRFAPKVQPSNLLQSLGKGTEQAGEFLVPGLGEEAALSKLPEAGLLKPAARIGYNALTSGAINKAQGGGFGIGALGGAAGSGVSEGMKAIAPPIAESALNIRKLDRAYKAPGAIGKSILSETKGFSPGAVAESAQGRLSQLNPMLEQAADRASVQPNRIRGMLQAPTQEIPLGEAPGLPEMPGGLLNAERFPPQNVGEARVIRNARGQMLPKAARNVEFPDESGKLPFGRNPKGQILSRQPTRQAWMAGSEDELPAVPPISGPGVLLRPPEMPSGGQQIPLMRPNPSASLASARGQLSSALSTATRQGERSTAGQLQPMFTHLGETMTGEPIPANVTPRRLLDLKRGFGNEFIHRWNPETMTGVKGTAGRTYHEMGQEFNRTVPEGKELNTRISNLIPVAKRGESAELNAPTTQRILGRFGAHTGALAGGLFGGHEGYEKYGAPGAIVGALGGMVAPEMLASPTTQMMFARGLNSAAGRLIPKAMAGGALQFRKSKSQPDR